MSKPKTRMITSTKDRPIPEEFSADQKYGPKLDVRDWSNTDPFGIEIKEGWSTNYYELPEGAKEIQDLIEYREMNFSVANIFKAAYRMGHKKGTSRAYDLNKIIWFAKRELARLIKEDKLNG